MPKNNKNKEIKAEAPELAKACDTLGGSLKSPRECTIKNNGSGVSLEIGPANNAVVRELNPKADRLPWEQLYEYRNIKALKNKNGIKIVLDDKNSVDIIQKGDVIVVDTDLHTDPEFRDTRSKKEVARELEKEKEKEGKKKEEQKSLRDGYASLKSEKTLEEIEKEKKNR